MMEAVTTWLFVALLAETITEILKAAFPSKIQDKVTFYLSLVIGVVLAYAFSLNPFESLGANADVSTVAAGIIASRGANFLNGLLKRLGIIKSLK